MCAPLASSAERAALAKAGPSMLNEPPQATVEPLTTRSGQDATRFLMPVFGRHQSLVAEGSSEGADRLLGWNWRSPTIAPCCRATAACSPACC